MLPTNWKNMSYSEMGPRMTECTEDELRRWLEWRIAHPKPSSNTFAILGECQELYDWAKKDYGHWDIVKRLSKYCS